MIAEIPPGIKTLATGYQACDELLRAAGIGPIESCDFGVFVRREQLPDALDWFLVYRSGAYPAVVEIHRNGVSIGLWPEGAQAEFTRSLASEPDQLRLFGDFFRSSVLVRVSKTGFRVRYELLSETGTLRFSSLGIGRSSFAPEMLGSRRRFEPLAVSC